MRSPSASAAISTPVRIGRASSLLAARTTWRKASPNWAAGRVTDEFTGEASFG